MPFDQHNINNVGKIALGEGFYLDILRQAIVKNEDISLLSSIDFRVFFCLVRNVNKLVSIDEIINFAWGEKPDFVSKNSVYNSISRLRKTIGEVKGQIVILNVRNVGYSLRLLDRYGGQKSEY